MLLPLKHRCRPFDTTDGNSNNSGGPWTISLLMISDMNPRMLNFDKSFKGFHGAESVRCFAICKARVHGNRGLDFFQPFVTLKIFRRKTGMVNGVSVPKPHKYHRHGNHYEQRVRQSSFAYYWKRRGMAFFLHSCSWKRRAEKLIYYPTRLTPNHEQSMFLFKVFNRNPILKWKDPRLFV